MDAEGALAAAKESEARWHAGEPLGPGDGIPTSIKDALWTRGWPTPARQHADRRSGPVGRGRAECRETAGNRRGHLGKTTTPEYSWKGVTDSFRHGVTAQPLGPRDDVGRVQRRQRGSGRPRHGAVVGRHGRRRLGADPRRVHRDGRAEAHLRAGRRCTRRARSAPCRTPDR